MRQTEMERQALEYDHMRRMSAMRYLGMGEESVQQMLDAHYRALEGLPPAPVGPSAWSQAMPWVQAGMGGAQQVLGLFGSMDPSQQPQVKSHKDWGPYGSGNV